MSVSGPNQIRCSGIPYLPMRKGFLYLVAVMAWHSRKVLSWRLSSTMETNFCVAALEEVLAKHRKPGIFNTDQGSRFTSFAFANVLRAKGIRTSWMAVAAGLTTRLSSASALAEIWVRVPECL